MNIAAVAYAVRLTGSRTVKHFRVLTGARVLLVQTAQDLPAIAAWSARAVGFAHEFERTRRRHSMGPGPVLESLPACESVRVEDGFLRAMERLGVHDE